MAAHKMPLHSRKHIDRHVRVCDGGQRADQLCRRVGEPGQHQAADQGRVVQAPATARRRQVKDDPNDLRDAA